MPEFFFEDRSINTNMNSSETPRILVHPSSIPVEGPRPVSRRRGNPDRSGHITDALPVYNKKLSLDKQLRNCSVKHATPGYKHFWPPSVWRALVTLDAVTNELLKQNAGLDRETIDRKARHIFNGDSQTRVLIFTILVLINHTGRLDHITSCKNALLDHDLPLDLDYMDDGDQSFFRRGTDQALQCCFAKFGYVPLNAFDDFQRQLTVPVFGLGKNNSLDHQTLDERDVLPWCEVKDVPPIAAMSGGFGTVMRVRIHPRCHGFHEVLKEVRFRISMYEEHAKDIDDYSKAYPGIPSRSMLLVGFSRSRSSEGKSSRNSKLSSKP